MLVTKEHLDLDTLSYDTLGSFIEDAAHLEGQRVPFILDKAAAYVDAAFALELLTYAEAEELLLCIQIYSGF